MAAGFLEGGLDAPAADEPAQDVHRVGVQVGAQEGLWLFLTLWIAHQHPADRHLHAGVMPERGAGGDVEAAFGAAIPASGPRSSALPNASNWAKRSRARFTRLLIVPTGTPQTRAASS